MELNNVLAAHDVGIFVPVTPLGFYYGKKTPFYYLLNKYS